MVPSAAPSTEVKKDDFACWERLFGFTKSQARNGIEEYGNDISRESISDELWDTLGPTAEPEAYDWEAYEYSRSLRRPRQQHLSNSQAFAENTGSYSVKLQAPIDTPGK